MAELSTPSAATMGTVNAGADIPASSKTTQAAPSTRPDKPDEEAFKASVEKARKALAEAQEETRKAQARVTAARPGNKDSPVAKRQHELRAELAAIRTKQQGFKTARTNTQDRIKVLDTQLKNKIQEQKNAKGRIPYKNAEEIDKEIARLEQQVDSGKMKLVDEKKALADITSLRKQRKAFGSLDEGQKAIDDLKATLAETRKELDNPEFKSLSDEYTRITKELDELKAEQDEAYKGLNASRDAVTKAKANQDQKYTELKALQDSYYQSKRQYMDFEREAARQRDARRKADREAYAQEKKRRILDQEMEDAQTPAYIDEIKAADHLMRLLDPSSVKSTTAAGPGEFAAVAQRTVDDTGIKGTRLPKKGDEEDSYFVGSAGKKGKKGRKDRNAAAIGSSQTESTGQTSDLGKFFDPYVVVQFSKVGVDPPISQTEIPTVFAQIKEKREYWVQHNDEKTKENVAAVQKKIDALAAGVDIDDSGEISKDAVVETKVANGKTEDKPDDGNLDNVTKSMNETSLDKDGTAEEAE